MMNFKVRDRRNKGWFFIDNDYLNGYAKFFGPIGSGVYLSLCRHAGTGQKSFPSQKLIAQELNIGERTVRDYLKILADHHLIAIARERHEGKWLNNVYTLLDKSEWIKPQAAVASGTKGKKQHSPEANGDSNQRQPLPTKNTNRKETHIRKERKITNTEDEARRIEGIKRNIRSLVGSKSI